MFSRFDENTHTFLSTHLIRPNGTQEVEIELPGPEGGGRWSHDGSRIAVMTVLEDQRIGTAIIKPDGTVDRVLDIPDPTLSLVCTVWSPDDQRLACEGFDDSDSTRNGILTVRASDGGDLKRLTSAPEGMNDLPGDYAPDGRQIVFMRTTGEAPGLMMLIDAAGGRPRPLSDDNYGDPGRFAPDGRSILTSAGHRLVTVDLEGQVLGTIEDAGSFLFGPVWSPDGRWIAYSRSTGGFVADVWVSRPDGRDAWRVTETAANEIVVEWGSGTD
jgi:Tol biopolymer transport system component